MIAKCGHVLLIPVAVILIALMTLLHPPHEPGSSGARSPEQPVPRQETPESVAIDWDAAIARAKAKSYERLLRRVPAFRRYTDNPLEQIRDRSRTLTPYRPWTQADTDAAISRDKAKLVP